jgi:hypothetical protein
LYLFEGKQKCVEKINKLELEWNQKQQEIEDCHVSTTYCFSPHSNLLIPPTQIFVIEQRQKVNLRFISLVKARSTAW